MSDMYQIGDGFWRLTVYVDKRLNSSPKRHKYIMYFGKDNEDYVFSVASFADFPTWWQLERAA